MTHVLLLIQNLESGGAERVFVNIANGLHKAGVRVDVLLGKREGVYFDLLAPGVEVHELNATTFVHYVRKLPSALKRAQYTHVVVAGDVVSAATLLTQRLFQGLYQVVLTHHYASPRFRSLGLLKEDALLKALHTVVTPHANQIVAVSAGTLAWLRRSSGHALPQARVIYNPVFDDGIYARGREALEFPLPTAGKKVLVSIGRLTTQKDQATLLRALATPQLRRSCVTFVLGAGPKEQELKALVARLGLTQCVAFVGHDPNPYRWLSRCDLFVLSSINEGFGNVIVEAMAFGKTVVSTNCPSGPAEILANGQFGYLCRPSDPDELARTIVRAISAPLAAEAITKRAQNYHTDRIIRDYLKVLGVASAAPSGST